MAERVQMLALSPTMETGTIANWLIKEGDTFAIGDVLCEVETDKATMEYESVQEGTLLKIIIPNGGEAMVEQAIAIVGEAGENVDELVAEIGAAQVASAASSVAATPSADNVTGVPQTTDTTTGSTDVGSGKTPSSVAPATTNNGGRIKASPLARRIADDRGLTLGAIAGTGPGGRIVKRDVVDAAPTPQGVAPIAGANTLADQTIPVSNKRRVIAQRLGESKYSAPHFYLTTSIFTETLMGARKQLNSTINYKVSVNAFLLKFAAEAIRRNPVINSSWQGDTIVQFGSIDIGLAVAQEDGLLTPIVRDCGSKGIVDIDRELSDLIERARSNKLAPEEFTGATFSISSLGTFGIEEFTAIINPPGSAILAIGQMQKVPVVDAHDQIVVRQQMKVTMSCDHRVIDGVKGAEFMTDFKGLMEDPVRALY